MKFVFNSSFAYFSRDIFIYERVQMHIWFIFNLLLFLDAGAFVVYRDDIFAAQDRSIYEGVSSQVGLLHQLHDLFLLQGRSFPHVLGYRYLSTL